MLPRLAAALTVLVLAVPAHAGVWAWGCQGQLSGPDQTVIFNRYQMVVLDGKRPAMDLHKLLGDAAINDLIKDNVVGYKANNINSGFEDKTIVFDRDKEPKGKITLTEVSSHRLSHKAKLICGRDDVTDTFRKTFRYERDNEKPRSITMQCIEYTLSTRGGRKGCD